MKNVLLTAINAKYIHSNLAVYSLRAYAAEHGYETELAEYTINQQADDILEDIYRKKPDILAFSCYIWNLQYVTELIRHIRLIMPEIVIWLGGPEVSYDAEEYLQTHPEADGIMIGEGEKTFTQLLAYYQEQKGMLQDIPGIVYRQRRQGQTGEGQILRTEAVTEYLNMDELPFPYHAATDFSHRIMYYESSRGCPFSCRYCLSSLDKRVRLRSLPMVEKELQFFLDRKVPQVKFVDRTFNCNHRHAMGIWNYIREHDNGVTNFHFEMEAALLNEEELTLLEQLRPGLIQLEIGVQTTNEQTLQAVNRRPEYREIAEVTARLKKAHNMHLHLDLIAGLPYEDYASFRNSFQMVYAMKPDELQLGFLKVLKGSGMREDADRYGLVFRQEPVYEILSTPWLGYSDLIRLKHIEEMLEVYYNSGQFSCTVAALENCFDSPFDLYESLAVFYDEAGNRMMALSRLQRLDMLRSFAQKIDPEHLQKYEDCLLMDLYLRENAKTRPGWARELSVYKQKIVEFYRQEEQERRLLPGYEAYTWKQMMNMTHLEYIPSEKPKQDDWVLFDYRIRDPINRNARAVRMKLS